MSLTAVGSIAFDSVRTPFGERERMLGGSAVHFALAASYFTEVRIVGPVGDDFGEAEIKVLEDRGVITDDIERVDGGQTFFWRGHYEYDMNIAHTDDTQLNVFADFDPKLSEASREADLLFLGNIDPELQSRVRASCRAAFAALDSMNFWLDSAREALTKAIAEVDCLLLNDAELRELSGEPNLARAARAAMELGPGVVVAKRGEYGAALFSRDQSLRSRATCSRTFATRPARGTASRAGSSATSTAAERRATRCSIPRCCVGRWPTARCSLRSMSKTSAPSASRR